MLRIIIFLATLIVTTLTAPSIKINATAAPACDATKCLLPDCRCSSTTPPAGVDIASVPQFVFLTFDDAVTALNYETYSEMFFDKTNPDGCPISLTFFLSHDYTDYSKVHDLYMHNHEIALHSITHLADTTYWQTIPLDDLRHEFGDEKTLVAKFANIPDDALQGMRVPFLQLSGDNTFEIGKELGLSYDCSWPTQTYRKPGLWPYTLDYKSTQDCQLGPCPADPITDFWVFPMIDWTDQQNIVCSMTDACVNIPDNTDDLFQWMVDNFNVQYQGNKAPFGFYIHAAWFATNPVHLEAYQKFFDYLQGLNDVYLVSPSNALKWLRNPVPVGSGQWPACSEAQDLGCSIQTCELAKGDELRYMTLCGDCPDVYPWLGNPLGLAP